MKNKKITLLLLVLFLVSACAIDKTQNESPQKEITESTSALENKDEENKESDNSKNDALEKTDEKESETSESDHLEETASFDQDQFIIDTFAAYGYEVPDKSQWIVKQEGPEKVAVIIKENLSRKGKPDISKLVFLIHEGKEPEILHLMVKNKVII